jgi:hypothetical protein
LLLILKGVGCLQALASANDNLMIIWIQEGKSICAKYYMPKKGWIRTNLLFPKANNISYLKAAMDSKGNVIAIWEQKGCSKSDLYANRYSMEKGWEKPILLATVDLSHDFYPSLSVAPNGNAIVIWRGYVSGKDKLCANYYTPTKGWFPEVIITSEYSYNSHVIMDSQGNAIVIWEQDYHNIWAKHYVVGEGWKEVVSLGNTKEYACLMKPTINAKGEAIVPWLEYDRNWRGIYVNHYEIDKGWSRVVKVTNAEVGEPLDSLHIEINEGGNAIVIWEDWDGERSNIAASFYFKDKGWKEKLFLENDNRGNAKNPKIALDSNNKAIVVWQQYDGKAWNIYGNCYTQDKGWLGAGLISTTNKGNAYNPQLAMNRKGNGIVVWQKYSDEKIDILAKYIQGALHLLILQKEKKELSKKQKYHLKGLLLLMIPISA